MKKVLSYKIICGICILTSVHANRQGHSAHHFTQQNTIQTKSGDTNNSHTYEYQESLNTSSPIYSGTTSLSSSRSSSTSVLSPQVPPRLPSTFTVQSQSLSSRTSSTNNNGPSDSFSFDPSGNAINDSLLTSTLKEPIYDFIPGENAHPNLKRNPTDPLPPIPGKFPATNHTYERISQAIPKPSSEQEHKQILSRRSTSTPESQSNFDEKFDAPQFIRD